MLNSYSFNVKELIKTILLFLIGVNIGGFGIHLICVLGILVVLENGISKRIKKDYLGFFLLLFLVSYAFFKKKYGGSSSDYYYYCILPFVFYGIGKRINSRKLDYDYSTYVVAPVVGLGTWGILNTFKTNISSLVLQSRQSVDFWSGQAIVSSKQASYFYLLACLLGIMIWTKKVSLREIVFLLILAIGMFSTGTRSMVLVFSAVALISYIFFLKTKNVSLHSKNKKTQKLIILALIIVIVLSVDLFGITTKISSSTLFLRLTGQAEHDNVSNLFDINGRDLRYVLFFSQILSHPFGNISLGDYGSAHNTFFDIYRVGGFIPFAFFTITMIIIYCKMYNMIKKYKYKENALLFICAIVGGMTLIFFVESMISLNIHVMSVYFFLIGIMRNMENKLKIKVV